jgi:hypothetical protein
MEGSISLFFHHFTHHVNHEPANTTTRVKRFFHKNIRKLKKLHYRHKFAKEIQELHVLVNEAYIDGQMGQARRAGTETARKSTAQRGAEGFVPRAGPARLSGRSWAATSARRPNTGTTRNWVGPMLARQF